MPVTLIANAANRGFPAAVNQGLRVPAGSDGFRIYFSAREVGLGGQTE